MKTKNKHLSVLFFLLFTVNINAQNLAFQWAKKVGGSAGNDHSQSITTDLNGNIYLTGYFFSTSDFDPNTGVVNLTSNGVEDIFIQKLDANGNLIWAKQIGGIGEDSGQSIQVDASGNAYITGYFTGTVDFNPGAGITNLSSMGIDDAFILKLDVNGDFLWVNQIGGTEFDQGLAVNIDPSGNVLTTGNFRNTIDFEPGPGITNLTSNGSDDVFIQKLDASGNFIWAKSMGGTSFDISQAITTDTNGNVYTTGLFFATSDFDPGPGTQNLISAGGFDIFVQKLDSNGNFLWVNQIGSTLLDVGRSITVDPSNNVYLTGYFSGTADFDSGAGTTNLTATGFNDIFIQKLDQSGSLIWVKQMGGPIFQRGHSITSDANGNVYTTGFFTGTVDFDPNPDTLNLTSAGDDDIYIQKLDGNGNLLSIKQIGNTFDDVAISITSDFNGNIYTTGFFQGTVDFDPDAGTTSLVSNNNEAIFVLKLSQCLYTSSTDLQTACDSYTWIDGLTYTTNNNSASFTLTNNAGCDSVVTLDLTINNSNSGSDIQTACESFTWIDGNTYTSSNNSATYTLTNINGCDSLVTLNLTINGVSNLTTSVNGLTITSNNVGIATFQWLDCNNGMNPISGETNNSYVATANGNYAVQITENGCIDTSACSAITTVGLLENEFFNNLTIHPNPNKGEFKIQFDEMQTQLSVRLFTISGQVIDSKKFKNIQNIPFEINHPSGVYFLEVTNGNNFKSTFKIIKK